jgi:hypothetical protein
MEQFIKTKYGIFNVRYIKKITTSYNGTAPSIQLEFEDKLSMIELLYDQEIKRQHDMKIITSAFKNGLRLIELEYSK